jgi:ribosomal protein S18 acetylase RimI-like enzyme
VRRAEVGDAAAIGSLHVRCWQATYRGLIPQDYLNGLDASQRAEQWRQHLAAPKEGGSVLIIDLDTQVAGFIAVGASRDEDGQNPGEVRAIYLAPEQWNRGHGLQLMAAGLDELRAGGFREATLWVLDRNDRARRFYERNGWRLDSAVKVDHGFGFTLDEVRYRRQL